MDDYVEVAMASSQRKKTSFNGDGLVVFLDVKDALEAEKVLQRAGYAVRLVAPPPQLRKGCDLALEVNLTEKPGIEQAALGQKDVAYVEIVPMKAGTAELLQVVKLTDFGRWVMVKAGNMKLSFDKETGVIVNSSGGGCPDIPYLHAELVDKKLHDVRRPKDIGFTLCAVMMDRALEECLEVWRGGDRS